MAVQGLITSSLTFNLSKSTGLPDAVRIPIQDTAKLSFPDGTTADSADLLYWRKYSLTGSVLDIDLQSLADLFGDSVSFAEITYGRVVNLSTTDPLKIGGASTITNAWTAWLSNPGTVLIRPKTTSYSAYIEFGTGFDPAYAVSPTSKILRLDPASATFDVVVILVGRSA